MHLATLRQIMKINPSAVKIETHAEPMLKAVSYFKKRFIYILHLHLYIDV